MRLPVTLILFCLFIYSKVNAQDITKPDTSKYIFEKVEVEASFTGGEQGWRKFLEKNLNPNVPVDNGAPSGKYTIMVQFIVNKDGSISDIKPLTNEGFGMEEEVVRILKKSGTWTPAQAGGKLVRAYRLQPVTFMMTEDGFDINSKVPYVLFTGTDNELTIEVDKVKNENIDVAISEGTITKTGDGQFIVRVNKTGRVLIKVFNSKKNNKLLGSVSFEVKDSKEK